MPEKIKYLGPDTYKSELLEIKAKRIIFIMYHIMGLRDGDNVPENPDSLNAIAEEHGIHKMDTDELIAYEKWLRLDL